MRNPNEDQLRRSIRLKGPTQQHKHQLQDQTTTKSIEVPKSYRDRIPSIWNKLDSECLKAPTPDWLACRKNYRRNMLTKIMYDSHHFPVLYFPQKIHHPLGLYNVKKKIKKCATNPATFTKRCNLRDYCLMRTLHFMTSPHEVGEPQRRLEASNYRRTRGSN